MFSPLYLLSYLQVKDYAAILPYIKGVRLYPCVCVREREIETVRVCLLTGDLKINNELP